jgi:protein gp37
MTMADKSKIEWTDATWNPLAGCTKVSPGCANCYAERMAKRLRAMGQEKYQDAVDDKGRWTGRVWLAAAESDLMTQPLRWQKPRRIFVGSMSDLFHEAVPFEFIRRVFHVMMDAGWHTFQVLTKRPAQALAFFHWYNETYWRKGWNDDDIFEQFARLHPNIWVGTSAENQAAYDERVGDLVRLPVAVHYLSLEPLLGPIDMDLLGRNYGRNYRGWSERVDWVIAGGESGPGVRPMHPDWVRSIRAQCQAADVPFFFKQYGAWGPCPTEAWHGFGPMGDPPQMVVSPSEITERNGISLR